MTPPDHDGRWYDEHRPGEQTRWSGDEYDPESDYGYGEWQPRQQTWEEQQRSVSPVALAPVRRHVLIATAVVVLIAVLGVAVYFTVRHSPAPPVAQPAPSTPRPAPVTSTPDSTTTETTTEKTTTESTTTTDDAGDPLHELAALPLSTSTATMAPSSCALPRFDLPDARQAQFFAAAKACADTAWNATLPAAGVPTGTVRLVTVRGTAANSSCGAVAPNAAPTECDRTVYMTPAYLRDVQGNGRYPGKYFGTFLREYAHAVQDTAGITAKYTAARGAQGADVADLERRYQDQAICLAGVASGAFAGRGAVDANITREIRGRITSGDAPSDAGSWLDKGFRSRQLSVCNTWTG